MDANKDAHAHHISAQFNQDLGELKTHLLTMGAMVDRQLQSALRALTTGDSELASQVWAGDREVDRMELTIDDEAIHVIARRHPAASDLRLVIAATKMVSDIERIGDEAKKIARITLELHAETLPHSGFVEVTHLGQHVTGMLRDALEAFDRFDADQAVSVIREDPTVDDEYRTATRSLMTYMMENPRNIAGCQNMMWVLRALERVGDHSENLAEQVIFMVKGRDVRHVSLNETERLLER